MQASWHVTAWLPLVPCRISFRYLALNSIYMGQEAYQGFAEAETKSENSSPWQDSERRHLVLQARVLEDTVSLGVGRRPVEKKSTHWQLHVSRESRSCNQKRNAANGPPAISLCLMFPLGNLIAPGIQGPELQIRCACVLGLFNRWMSLGRTGCLGHSLFSHIGCSGFALLPINPW